MPNLAYGTRPLDTLITLGKFHGRGICEQLAPGDVALINQKLMDVRSTKRGLKLKLTQAGRDYYKKIKNRHKYNYKEFWKNLTYTMKNARGYVDIDFKSTLGGKEVEGSVEYTLLYGDPAYCCSVIDDVSGHIEHYPSTLKAAALERLGKALERKFRIIGRECDLTIQRYIRKRPQIIKWLLLNGNNKLERDEIKRKRNLVNVMDAICKKKGVTI